MVWPFVPKAAADEILATLAAVQYEWEPNLEDLEPELRGPDEARLARYLLGQLVFSGYAQQTGAPHVLAPKRSLMLAAVGLRTAGAGMSSEAAIYEELARRFRSAGGVVTPVRALLEGGERPCGIQERSL